LKNKTGFSTSVGTSGLTRATGFWGSLGKIVTGLAVGGGTGAIAGSAVPVVGTAIGGIVGGIIGAVESVRRQSYSKLTGQQQDFISGVEQTRSQLSLDNLVNAKARGATFGALSEKELTLLSASATKLGTWAIQDKNGVVSGYNVSERAFKQEMDKINNFAKLDYILKGGNPADIGVQITPDGSIVSINSDGTITKIN